MPSNVEQNVEICVWKVNSSIKYLEMLNMAYGYQSFDLFVKVKAKLEIARSLSNATYFTKSSQPFATTW